MCIYNICREAYSILVTIIADSILMATSIGHTRFTNSNRKARVLLVGVGAPSVQACFWNKLCALFFSAMFSVDVQGH